MTRLASGHLTAGEPALAAALLRAGLLDVNPDTAPPDLDLADAAAVYATALHPRGTPNPLALRWTRYAHRSTTLLLGDADQRTVHATGLLADVLTAHRLDIPAIGMRRRLVDLLTARDGALAPTTVAACVRLAVTEHAAGHCEDGITGLTSAWQRWSTAHGTDDLRSVAMLLDLAEMLAACGRSAEAARARGQALAAVNAAGDSAPPPPHPTLPGTSPGRDHAALCARRRRRPSRSDSQRRTRRSEQTFTCQEWPW